MELNKRTLRYLKNAIRDNKDNILNKFTPAELDYIKKQLALTDTLRKLEIVERRTTKGFSN